MDKQNYTRDYMRLFLPEINGNALETCTLWKKIKPFCLMVSLAVTLFYLCNKATQVDRLYTSTVQPFEFGGGGGSQYKDFKLRNYNFNCFCPTDVSRMDIDIEHCAITIYRYLSNTLSDIERFPKPDTV
jgi:hypothetical protein